MAENAKNAFVHINLDGPFLPKKTNKSDFYCQMLAYFKKKLYLCGGKGV